MKMEKEKEKEKEKETETVAKAGQERRGSGRRWRRWPEQ